MNRYRIRSWSLVMGFALLAGCGEGGPPGGLRNKNPGDNDVGVVAAFGDSITLGNRCDCAPYPARVQDMTDKTVVNAGLSGSQATENVSRARAVIQQTRPGFMLILYGHNDITHGVQTGTIVDALRAMVEICLEEHVVPVLATYPEPIGDHAAYAPRELVLNGRIRDLATELGLECVDLEAEFAGGDGLFIEDGLHPNEAGTQIIAMAFADLF
ncbi:MAG: SGNH/GDSL hydrolase family protein [Kiritimatiellia bacterium]